MVVLEEKYYHLIGSSDGGPVSAIPKKLRSIQDYPFVIRRELDKIKIYSPDFDVQYSDLPSLQSLPKQSRKNYYQMLGVAMLKAWQQAEQVRADLFNKHNAVPSPSASFLPTEPQKEKLLSPQEVADRKGCHVQTVRRAIDREELQCILTPGGHRKIPEVHAEAWIRKSPRREKGRPNCG